MMFLNNLDLTFKAYCLSKEKINGYSSKLHLVLKLKQSMQCDFIATLKNSIQKSVKSLTVLSFLSFWKLVHFWWTLHQWHDFWIFSWLHIINWHSIIYQELVRSYTLFQFRDTLSVIHVKEEKPSIHFVHLSKYSTRAFHTIYSRKEYHSFHRVPLHPSLLVPPSFMGIKFWDIFSLSMFFSDFKFIKTSTTNLSGTLSVLTPQLECFGFLTRAIIIIWNYNYVFIKSCGDVSCIFSTITVFSGVAVSRKLSHLKYSYLPPLGPCCPGWPNRFPSKLRLWKYARTKKWQTVKNQDISTN
jgi:hypothetical protein